MYRVSLRALNRVSSQYYSPDVESAFQKTRRGIDALSQNARIISASVHKRSKELAHISDCDHLTDKEVMRFLIRPDVGSTCLAESPENSSMLSYISAEDGFRSLRYVLVEGDDYTEISREHDVRILSKKAVFGKPPLFMRVGNRWIENTDIAWRGINHHVLIRRENTVILYWDGEAARAQHRQDRGE